MLVTLLLVLLYTFLGACDAQTCRYIPGDDGWPTQCHWSRLNRTVEGQLIKTVPQGSVCHTAPFSRFDGDACEDLQTIWASARTFVEKPGEVTNAYFQNRSCDAFTPSDEPCELGNYASYSINVTGADDVRAGMRFAQEHNVRLVIKSTGHDYMGKSTGAGALALWMYNLKTKEVIENYESPAYSGPAVRLGAGVIGGEAYQVAASAGYRVVGGECASVGIASGYSQGGGHSTLTSAYGMAADNVLEWEVVTAQGDLVTASPTENSDLYWALSGGGGGTYGVVLSMTARLHPDGPVAGGSLVFDLAGADGNETLFWEAVELWQRHVPSIVNDQNTVLYNVFNNSLSVFTFTLPDQESTELEALLGPFLGELEELGLPWTLSLLDFPSYTDHYQQALGVLPWGEVPLTTMTSRLVPRWAMEEREAGHTLAEAMRSIVQTGEFLIGCVALSLAGAEGRHPDNAVLPAWRNATAICNTNAFWNYQAPMAENLRLKQELVDVHIPTLEDVTPGSGVYLNEVDPLYTGDWKKEMYGSNYDRLLQIKHDYDPDSLFYALFAVGSDEFTIDNDGRLCSA